MSNSKKDILTKLVQRLQTDYSKLDFQIGGRFLYHPPHTIFYNPTADIAHPELQLLHELGHALLGQNDYQSDIELVKIESQAWQQAKQLCATYDIFYDEDYAESCLDSYRDWLHHNSLCPHCAINGYQDDHGLYHCPLCHSHWASKQKAT